MHELVLRIYTILRISCLTSIFDTFEVHSSTSSMHGYMDVVVFVKIISFS